MLILNVVMNGIRKGISLFSGCGGSGLGYKLAGVDIVYANEFVKRIRYL